MATFSRSSFIPNRITLSPECIKDPLVLQLKVINNNMRKIDAYVVLGLKGKRKLQDEERRKDAADQRRRKQNALESQKKANPFRFIKDSLPKTGFLDAIRNFILYTAMGMMVPFVLKNLPIILGAVKALVPVYKFLEGFFSNVLGGVVSAIDFGYKVHDKVRGVLKTITGGKFEKTFDELSQNLNTFLNLAVVVGLAAAGSGAGNIIKPGQKPAIGTLPASQLSRYNESYSRFIQGQANIGDRARLLRRGAIDTRQALTRGGTNVLAQGAARRAAAQSSNRAIGKFGRVFSRVPIVGGLISFALSLMMGEKIGRAAAKAVGFSLGTALGVFIPIPIAGPILGGILGDIVGGGLYDTIASFGKPTKLATGGQVGRKKGKTSRSIRRIKVPRPPKQIRQRTVPGKNVGGEDAIRKIFPESENEQMASPLRLLKRNAAVMKRGGILGSLLSSGVELMALGQKVERPTLMGLEKYLAYVIDSSINDQATLNTRLLANSMFAMASGGTVPVGRTIGQGKASTGSLVAKEIVRSFTAMLNNRSVEIFQNIRREMELQGPGSITPPGGGMGDDTNVGIVFNALLAEGFTFNQAAGIVGNLMQESGGGTKNLDPRASNNIAGGHTGIAQWDNSLRWPRLKAYIQSIKKDPFSIEGQAAGLIWELKTHEKKAYEALKKANSPEEAAQIFAKEFERSGEVKGQPGFDARIRFAQQLAREFSSNKGGRTGNAIFGSTGRGWNAEGWVHGHFQDTDRTALLNNTFSVVKRLLQQGSSVVIAEVDLNNKMADSEIKSLINAGIDRHSDRTRGYFAVDVSVKKGTRVPIQLVDIKDTKKYEGIRGFIPGTNTFIGHLDPASLSSGSSSSSNKPQNTRPIAVPPPPGTRIAPIQPQKPNPRDPIQRAVGDIFDSLLRPQERSSIDQTNPLQVASSKISSSYSGITKSSRYTEESSSSTILIQPVLTTT